MAESPDAAVTAQRAALAETRRRITSSLDAIEGRVRPSAARLATGVTAAHQASGALTLLATGVATARQASRIVRTVRSLSRGELALAAGGVATAIGLLEWWSRERARPDRRPPTATL